MILQRILYSSYPVLLLAQVEKKNKIDLKPSWSRDWSFKKLLLLDPLLLPLLQSLGKPRENLIKQNLASWDECLMFSFTNCPLKFLDGWHQWHNRYVAGESERQKNYLLFYAHNMWQRDEYPCNNAVITIYLSTVKRCWTYFTFM